MRVYRMFVQAYSGVDLGYFVDHKDPREADS